MWLRDLLPERMIYKQEAFDRSLLEMARSGVPPSELGRLIPFFNQISIGRASHPLGLINAGDPTGAADDSAEIGKIYARETAFALRWAGLYNAAIAEACKPGATVESVLAVARGFARYRAEGGLLYAGYDTVERDLMHNPGLHKVLLGNGLATSVAGFLGGVPETTYGENIGVLAITRVFSSRVIQGAAVIAILLSFIQKFGAAIQTIPQPVLGGVTIILYGMIASVGLRTLIENKVDMAQNRNLLIVSVIFSFGVGGMIFKFGPDFEFAGIASAAISGIILNLFLPMEKKKEAAK